MKKSLFFILLLCTVVCTAKAQEIRTVTRYEGMRISGVEAGSAFHIEIRQGEKTGLTLTVPARLESQLVTELKNDGKVEFGFRGNVNLRTGEKCNAVIVCTTLEEIDLSGACVLTGTGDFSGSKLEIDLSGASRATIEGKIQLSGKLEADLQGSAQLKAAIWPTEADIEVSGAAQMTLTGNTGMSKLECSGASKVDLSDFVVRVMDIDISGASKVDVNATELVSGEISGAAKVNYVGTPETKVRISGGATWRKK